MKKMTQTLALTFLFAVLSITSFAQPKKGDINLNVGIGAGISYSIGSLSMPPIGASIDYNLDERISIGGIVTFATSGFDYGYGKYTLNYIRFGVRGNYHFASSEKVDPYVGVLLGYTLLNEKWKGTDNDPGYKFNISVFSPGAYIGARYRISESFGIFGELGYPLLRAGVNIKF